MLSVTSQFNPYINNKISFKGKTSHITNEQLKTLLDSGKTIREIKNELGIALDTFYKLLRERGFEYKKIKRSSNRNSISKNKLQSLIDLGKSNKEICKILNIKIGVLYSLLEDFGIKTNSKIKKESLLNITKEELLSFVDSKLTAKEICKKLGNISEKTYYSLLKKFNIKPQRHNKIYIEEEQLKVINAKIPVKGILEKLNIKEDTYYTKLLEYGIKTDNQLLKDKISNITKEEILALINKEKNVQDICRTLGITPRTYTRLLNKFNITTKRKASNNRIKEISIEMLQNTIKNMSTVKEACEKLNIAISTFYKLIKKYQIEYNYIHHNNEKNIDINKLKELANSGKEVKKISKELGIDSTTYYRKVSENQIKTKLKPVIDKISRITKEEIQKIIDSGASVNEICTELKISKSNYKALLEKYNLNTMVKQNQAHNKMIKKENIIALKEKGYSKKEICELLDITPSTYQRIFTNKRK